MTLGAVHMSVPKLRVSPLALPPPALRIERFVSIDDCQVGAMKKRLPIYYLI